MIGKVNDRLHILFDFVLFIYKSVGPQVEYCKLCPFIFLNSSDSQWMLKFIKDKP